MMPYLLDVNVLIALIDTMHVHHRRAMAWFISSGQAHWLTCPTTENGAIRIISGTKYPQSGITPSTLIGLIRELSQAGRHIFVPDNISLISDSGINAEGLRRSSQVTDTYLLTLAVANQAQLATMDHRLHPDAVIGGAAHLHRIP